MRLPREIGPIHFIGIGGIGMSGIAEVLNNLGYTVQGSDASDGYNVERLRKIGITVSVGHKAESIAGACCESVPSRKRMFQTLMSIASGALPESVWWKSTSVMMPPRE